MQRTDLSGYEQFMGCHELKKMNPTWQLKDLGESLSIALSTVTKILSPSKCTKEWQDALREGLVGISDCCVASKLPLEKQSELLALKLTGLRVWQPYYAAILTPEEAVTMIQSVGQLYHALSSASSS